MANAIKYHIGDMFKSTRFDDVFLIYDIIATDKPKISKKGKELAPKIFAYIMSYIPETKSDTLPSGEQWTRTRKHFQTSDEIIDKEISMGNWIKSE